MVNFPWTEMSQIYRGHTRKGLVFCKGFTGPKKVWSSSDRPLPAVVSVPEEADTRTPLHADVSTLTSYVGTHSVLVAHLPKRSPGVWMFSGTAKQKRYVPHLNWKKFLLSTR